MGGHQVASALCHPAELRDRGHRGMAVARRTPSPDVLHHLLLDGWIHRDDGFGSAERRGRRLGEPVDADHHLLSGLDPAGALGHRLYQPSLQLLDGLERAPESQDLLQLGRGRIAQLGCPRLDDAAPVENVLVLEQVGLEGQHLLHPQRPLLIPRRRQSERLVPRR